ncbi:UDP-N-acetylmuramoyl-L-alanyl-D-glutamate--2,6-diaminopimelate ligase MurE homolog, chloroplastic-like [Typha angustifolia]|uniref:UDP-N-acetylmuramoyl-L-alanyl-D-glutamate--2, 6-diaminopimelate ligase MurE homolog, chloroplastic-like n=1 Tax=Typha angustifolia TaxID=59011 RepID=UPI003C2C14C1
MALSSPFSFPCFSPSPPLLLFPFSKSQFVPTPLRTKINSNFNPISSSKRQSFLSQKFTITSESKIRKANSTKLLSRKLSFERKTQMTLGHLLELGRVAPVDVLGDMGVLVTGIKNDSREVNPGDLFVCCVGSETDGHLYISNAISRGAVAVMADKEVDIGLPLVVVEDTNSVLPVLASVFFNHPSKRLTVIGITGTNGKTTTTNLVYSIFESMELSTGMIGTLGYYIDGDKKIEAVNTTPDALMTQRLMASMVQNGNNAVVMEASSHGLELGRCDEIDFDVAVFTNLTRDHLDFHGSEEEYRKSKSKLFAKMVDPKRHRKVVNIDDKNASYFLEQGNADVPVVTFGMENENADVRPLKFELSLFKTEVLISTPEGTMEITSGMLGRYNIYNILAAVAVGIAVGAPMESIVRGIEGVAGVPGRCELIDEGQPFAVVVDYAHTPDALSRLLDAMRELGPRRIITVVGCGGQRDSGKRPLMTKIAGEKSDVVILTSDNPRKEDPLDILDDMLAGVGWNMRDYLRQGGYNNFVRLPNGHQLFVEQIRRVALQAAIAMGEEGDIIIIAGKGHETYQIEGDTKRFFDDRLECREALHYVHELRQAGIDNNEFPWQLPDRH